MSKRSFKHVGDITTGDFGYSDACLVITDRSRLHEVTFRHKAGVSLQGGLQSAVATDEDKLPIAVAVSTAQASDSVFYPVFLEIETDADGKETILSVRIHLHPKDSERIKAPRTHKAK